MFEDDARILLAISGGVDSMVLAHLFLRANMQFEIAHFDHLTRQGASTEDANFVKQFAEVNGIKIHLAQMSTETSKHNFQAEARRQRYDFFKSIGASHIVTAHHKDDDVENVFINFIQGKSLKRIPETYNEIVRPLLPFSKTEIIQYANENDIAFREDASNATNDYLRNHVRNILINAARSKIENLDDRILNISSRYEDIREHMAFLSKSTLGINHDLKLNTISKSALEHSHIPPGKLLFYALESYGFSQDQCDNAIKNLSKPGKIFNAANAYELLIDRDKLILKAVDTKTPNKHYHLSVGDIPATIQFGNSTLQFEIVSSYKKEQSESVFQCPLDLIDDHVLIRKWVDGDKFQPFGMKGKQQSLKKFFANNKLDLFSKQNIPLVCNGNGEIMWICGLRSDERYRCKESTSPVLRITLS